jgi:multidrug transporter EmrE-like cation transporter
MTARGLPLILGAALTTVAGNLLLRSGVLHAGGLDLAGGGVLGQLLRLAREPLFLLGAGLYAVSALIWFSVISTEQLSTAYPLLISITLVLVTAGCVIFYGERVSPAKYAGLALMVVSIWLVATK